MSKFFVNKFSEKIHTLNGDIHIWLTTLSSVTDYDCQINTLFILEKCYFYTFICIIHMNNLGVV